MRFVAGLGDEGIDAEHGLGLFQRGRRHEIVLIGAHRCHQIVRRELPGEGEGQAEAGGELGAEGAGAQQPDGYVQTGAGHRDQSLAGLGLSEIMPQLIEHLRKVLAIGATAAQRPGGSHVGAGRAAETQIDAARIQRLQGAELLGDLQRRVVRQHDAARADADTLGTSGQIANDHRRGGAGDADHVVMLGHPEALVAQLFGLPGQLQTVAQGLCRGRVQGDGTEIQNRERYGGGGHKSSGTTRDVPIMLTPDVQKA